MVTISRLIMRQKRRVPNRGGMVVVVVVGALVSPRARTTKHLIGVAVRAVAR